MFPFYVVQIQMESAAATSEKLASFFEANSQIVTEIENTIDNSNTTLEQRMAQVEIEPSRREPRKGLLKQLMKGRKLNPMWQKTISPRLILKALCLSQRRQTL